jgi:hypothetical protein
VKGRLVNGHEIEARPVHYPNAWSVSTRNDIPHVNVRRVGSTVHDSWTPAEARAFAAALISAADEAEVKP